MKEIQAPARVTVTKGRLFTRRRFLAELWIGDIHTGLTWSLTRKEAKTFPQLILDNATQLLASHGLMEEMYARYAHLEGLRRLAKLPAPGSKVRLLADTLGAELPVGTVGTVTKVDAETEAPYPLSVAFVVGDKTEEVPLELTEVEAV